ncbi:MAG: hypothetical protein HKN77_10550, partial [Woeseiaceae bacterium]|nr:hypothetical protein [Woeseiaceae bacterium]
MKYLERFILAAVIVFLTACTPDPAETGATNHADLILTNARVYTLDWGAPGRDGTPAPDAPRSEHGWHPDAEAVATKGGDIVFVGSTQDAL